MYIVCVIGVSSFVGVTRTYTFLFRFVGVLGVGGDDIYFWYAVD